MNEKKTNENAVNEVAEKETILQKAARKQTERRARRAERKAVKAEEPKKTVKEWIGDHKVAVGGGLAILVGSAIAVAKAAKRCGSDEIYDPDFECEPGDDFPGFEDSSDETANEEVNAE